MSLKGSHVSAVVNAPAYPLQPLLTRGNGGEGSCDQARTDKTLVSIHFTYYTPLRLICMWKSESALCHICQLFQGTFIHMVWECPKIRPLWSQVTEFMADHFGFPNICNPLLCLLGAINDEKNVTKQFIRLIRFYVRKPIAIRWIYTETFTLAMWEKLVNADPTLYKMTYEHGYALKNVPNLVPVEGLSSFLGGLTGRLSIWGTIGWGCFVLVDCPGVCGVEENGARGSLADGVMNTGKHSKRFCMQYCFFLFFF